MVKKIVEEPKVLEDGKYEGVIINTEYREKPFEYLDLIIETKINEKDTIKLKCGYPFKIMPESKLGLLLTKFGARLKIGEVIDTDDYLVGKPCSFLVAKKGKYANIMSETVQPLSIEQNLRDADYEHN